MKNRILHLWALLFGVSHQASNCLRIMSVAVLMFVAFVAFGQTALPTAPNSMLMNNVVYKVTSNTTITATEAGQSGLRVAQGAKVVIDIKKGVTLTVTGANADAAKGYAGMPGILVPETSTLVVIGEGNLVATGGNGTNGLPGGDGQNAGGYQNTANFTYTYAADQNFGGYGGAGGDGGYGAGAGIGGAGGKGGAGGAQTASGAKGDNYSGATGNAGAAGSVSGGMGKVYVLGKVTVRANAGAGGTNAGAAGKNGVSGYTTAKANNYYYSIGGGGAGGGGAAGDAPVYAFGAGGASGGGGGSGGQGGADRNDNYAANAGKTSLTLGTGTDAQAMTLSNAICTAGAGSGGQGTKAGVTTSSTRDDGPGRTGSFKVFGITLSSNIQHYPNIGGAGGAAGAKGGSGADGNVYKLNTATITSSTTTAAKNLQTYTSESQIPAEIRALYEVAISFDNQGGSAARQNEVLIKGEPMTSLSGFQSPTKSGNYFEGYFTEIEGGEKIYDHNGNVVDAARTFTSNKTLYARWINNQFAVIWDYSYADQSGSLKTLNQTDKSAYAKVQFNVGDAFIVPAGKETNGSGTLANHKISTATITAQVGNGTNTASTIYVTEDQLKALQISATALNANDISATDNKYISTNNSAHEVVLSAVPEGTYMQPWSITITNEKKPDVLNVKLLRANSVNGTYEVISQHTAAFACTNNNGVYTGTYPVWPKSALNENLYYKVQIAGYEIDGVTHEVSSMPLCGNVSSNAAQQTLSQEIALPIVHFDLNAPKGTSPHFASGSTEYKYAAAYGENIDISGYSAELQDYRIEGWTASKNADQTIKSVIANGDVTVYATWADAVPPVISFTGSHLNQEEDANGYMHGSLDVYVHVEDANDGLQTEQWYYVADNNKVERLEDSEWKPLTTAKDGESGTYVVAIEGTQFAYGYIYIKAKDKDGNFSYMISDQYKVDNQAPFITHEPEGRREEDFSVVCSDEDYPTIDVTITDNVQVKTVSINGKDVTNGSNLPVGVTTKLVEGVRHFYLAKPGKDDATEYDNNRNPIIPDFKVYTITATDGAGNTSTRMMNVYLTHEWNKDQNGNYVVEAAAEPTEDKPGLLPHVNCKHCARYILVRKNGEWMKIDKENPSQLAEVQLLPGCILVMNDVDIFYGAQSINEALTKAKDTYNKEGTAQNPIGKATIVKLTPSATGTKVDAQNLSNATLVNPGRAITLDLNGQSIDKDGVAYSEVIGNSNVTILLNDGNNRADELGKNEIPYSNLSPVTGSPIKYVRKFSAIQSADNDGKGTWQSLYLPFSCEKPNDLKVGTIKKVSIDDTRATLQINRWEDGDGSTLDAYTPYFVQHSEGLLELTSTTRLEGYSKDTGSKIDGCNYTIAGSLKTDDQVAEKAKNFWSLTNGGGFNWVKVGVSQRPYRWVIYGDPEVDTNNVKPSRTLMLYVLDPEDEVTGISNDTMESVEENSDVYTISGVKMSKNGKLPRGVYISNGKKFYVK